MAGKSSSRSLRDKLRVKPGSRVDLAKWDPEETFGRFKDEAGDDMASDLDRLANLQERLYAESIGVAHVFVGGTEIVRDSELLDALPGRLLRSGRDTVTITASGGPTG